jgi:hypothetical protein
VSRTGRAGELAAVPGAGRIKLDGYGAAMLTLCAEAPRGRPGDTGDSSETVSLGDG